MVTNHPDTHNFSIIAHIDRRKSTLAGRLLGLTDALPKREMAGQILDSMDLERGITGRAHAVRLCCRARDGKEYQVNLIDTPGHVDFTHEVSRSLAACEGALLVIDASQGVKAQTLANAQLAMNDKLAIIPVINRIDLPGADIEATKQQIEHALALDPSEAIRISAKQGAGAEEVQAVVARVPPPKPQRVESLRAGEVGFMITNVKRVQDTRIGDTITDDTRPAAALLPGFEEVKPMVFAGLYPVDADDYEPLRDALKKLRLNDSSFFYEPENSVAFGSGFR